MRAIVHLWRERRFVPLYACLLPKLAAAAATSRVRTRCPGLPDLRGNPDAVVGFAPSVMVGYSLWIGLPMYVGLDTHSLKAALASAGVGSLAFRVGDRLLLGRLDRAHLTRWRRCEAERKRPATGVVALATRTSTMAFRGARRCFAVGVCFALLTFGASALGAAEADAAQLAAAVATVALLLACVLGMVLVVATMCEMLAPTLLGPAGDGAYCISREDVERLRPLSRSGPAGLLRDAWDLLKALRL